MLCHNTDQMKRPNLYLDAEGKQVKGRYIYPAEHGKFLAICRYPEGYNKSKVCYEMEEAVAFVRDEYDTYAPGWYYNSEMDKVFLRRPGDVRPERMF
jgi:hypothetical protein